MKKIFISTFIAISLLSSISCNEDTVEVTPIGYTEAGFFSSEQEFDWAARGVYMKLGIYFAFQGDPNRVIAAVFMLPDDDLATRNGAFSEENFAGRRIALVAFTTHLIRLSNAQTLCWKRSRSAEKYIR